MQIYYSTQQIYSTNGLQILNRILANNLQTQILGLNITAMWHN